MDYFNIKTMIDSFLVFHVGFSLSQINKPAGWIDVCDTIFGCYRSDYLELGVELKSHLEVRIDDESVNKIASF